jgi:hypothetical protein
MKAQWKGPYRVIPKINNKQLLPSMDVFFQNFKNFKKIQNFHKISKFDLGLLFDIIKQLLPSMDCKHQNC